MNKLMELEWTGGKREEEGRESVLDIVLVEVSKIHKKAMVLSDYILADGEILVNH